MRMINHRYLLLPNWNLLRTYRWCHHLWEPQDNAYASYHRPCVARGPICHQCPPRNPQLCKLLRTQTVYTCFLSFMQLKVLLVTLHCLHQVAANKWCPPKQSLGNELTHKQVSMSFSKEFLMSQTCAYRSSWSRTVLQFSYRQNHLPEHHKS